MTTPQPQSYSPTLFGREPALLLGAVNGVIVLFSALVLPLDGTQQGMLNIVASAVLGLVVAIKVRAGTWAAAVLAVLNALIAAALAFNFELSPEIQSGILLFATAILSYATRAIVTPPQPPAIPGSSKVA